MTLLKINVDKERCYVSRGVARKSEKGGQNAKKARAGAKIFRPGSHAHYLILRVRGNIDSIARSVRTFRVW